MNEGFGEEIHRIGNSVKRFQDSMNRRSLKLKSSTLIPFPNLSSNNMLKVPQVCDSDSALQLHPYKERNIATSKLQFSVFKQATWLGNGMPLTTPLGGGNPMCYRALPRHSTTPEAHSLFTLVLSPFLSGA